MIQLTDDLIFAEGGRRYCFVHPDNPNKCIKTLSPNGDPAKRRKEAQWYKKLRPLSMFDDNQRELKSFNDLAKKSDAVWAHFPRCYGIQETSRGDGIVTDLIRDVDGSVSQTVRQYVKANGKTPELVHALEEFFDLFRHEIIITRDILDHNLVVQIVPDKLTIYMIDGFGSSEILPFSAWFKPLGKNKVARKVVRFTKRYKINQITVV
ncbi:MAG TPA: YrbL family protein [Pontiella sp.]